MYVGVDYYPEHRSAATWPNDAALMKKAGFNVVRLAEFAWKTMEPEEGYFEFQWLDDILALLNKNRISVILGTPTAGMPAWCARKYPQTLAVEKNGQRITWGVRKDNCYSSGRFRQLSERITTAMAEHFHRNANVIGWQADNELSIPVCYCENCKSEFHNWLRTKYRNLKALNKAWGTHFWNHQYGEWEEITLPVNESEYNPGLSLDWNRFHTWLVNDFKAGQVKILREKCPKQFVTTNFMGFYSGLDYHKMVGDLDFVSWDNYPVGGDKPGIRYNAAFGADLIRGLKNKNFWVMEQQMGSGGWVGSGRSLRPGEARNLAFQQVARGADGLVWFPWQSCPAGREQYWHGLLDYDSKPSRRYWEVLETVKDLRKIERVLDKTTVHSDIAMIYDYESLWAVRIQPGYYNNDYLSAALRYYNALFRLGLNVDVIKPAEDFSKYRVIFAPDLHVLPDALANRLDKFVKDGGILVTECRAAVKNETNLCHERTLPGLLSRCLGIEIPEHETLEDGKIEYPLKKENAFRSTFTGIHAADWVKPTTAETLVGYEPSHMKQFSAVTRNKYGKGFGFYVGTIVKESGFHDLLMQEVLKPSRVEPIIHTPQGVEVSVRSGKQSRVLFLINHTEETQTVPVPPKKAKVLIGKKKGNAVELDGFGVAVLYLAQ